MREFLFRRTFKSTVVFGDFSKSLYALLKKTEPSSVVLFFDPLVMKKHKVLKLKTQKNISIIKVSIKSSEDQKSFQNIGKTIQLLQTKNIDRKCLFVGLGGGVVGDYSGFIASIYMRGVSFVSAPTTLLAMVDSGVGGKNGVNFKNSKNLVGQTRQPQYVVIDSKFLKTLPTRELLSGFGEVVKYSLLSRKIPFSSFQNFQKKPQQYIQKCISLKMHYVCKDEEDTQGIRQALNLGHTFGHALESYTKFRKYKHGEAILWGLKFTLMVSKELGYLKEAEYHRLSQYLQTLPMPLLPVNLNVNKLYKLALKDKKSENKTVKMVLLRKRGRIITSVPVSKEIFIKCVKYL